jgi:uncharacterized protein (TIGR04255 family)
VPATSKRYKSAPIVEAVIELRVTTDAMDQPSLQRLATALKTDFPKQAAMQRVRMGIQAEQGRPIGQSMSQSVIGMRLTRDDDSRVLQIRNEGWAYSHLAPYTDWKTFRAEALPLWREYRTACPDAKLTRCGLRYINRFDIPGERIEPEDYFQLYPHVPELPQKDVISMEMMLQIPQHDLECAARISQAMLPEPAIPNHLPIILDVDIFRIGIEGWSDDEAWSFLDKMRERKNEIFEGCITDRTRELIDK